MRQRFHWTTQRRRPELGDKMSHFCAIEQIILGRFVAGPNVRELPEISRKAGASIRRINGLENFRTRLSDPELSK